MSKPFDAATKHLIEVDPMAWLHLVGLPGTAAELIDADLSTITTEADRVLRVASENPYLLHIELESGRKLNAGKRVMRYAVLLEYRHELPVEAVLILLRPEADGPGASGRAGFRSPSGQTLMTFEYRVVRVWELPVDGLLTGPLATLPLAPLASVSPDDLSAVIAQMEQRVEHEASPQMAGIIWTTTLVLMGLRYERELIHDLLKGVRGMEESVTYQEIIEKGEARGKAIGRAEGKEEGRLEGKTEEARRLLIRLGTRRFGPPDETTRDTIACVPSLERLELLIEQVGEAKGWTDLLP